MPTAKINGFDMYYETHGDGWPVAFAHGVGGNHLSWWQQVPYFQKEYQCIIFDHRGFGNSRDKADGPGAKAFVSDLAALLDHLGIQECSIVAQSMGGRTGFGFSLEYPERLRSLVMADTILGIPSRAIGDLRTQLIKEGRAMTGHTYLPSLWDRAPSLAFLYEEIRKLNPPLPSTEDRQRAALAEPPLEDWDLSGFKIPTLFLFGSEDGQLPADLGKLAHKIIPGSRYAEVADTGHSVYFERGDEFNRIVGDFLEETTPR